MVELELEVAVALGGARHSGARRAGQRGPSEVGVDDHPGRVDHGAQRWPVELEQQLAGASGQVVGDLSLGSGVVGGARGSGEDRLAPLLDRPPGGGDGEPVGRVELGGQLVDRGQLPQTGRSGVVPGTHWPSSFFQIVA